MARRSLLRFLLFFIIGFAYSLPAASDSVPRHGLMIGMAVDSYTDFGTYGTIQTGAFLEYGYSPFDRQLSELRYPYIDVSAGLRTGITFESLRSFSVAFSPRLFPFAVPFTVMLRPGLILAKWLGASVFLDGGANIVFYRGISPYLLFSFSGGLALSFYFSPVIGIRIDAGWGLWGRDRDYWKGPVARAGVVVKL